MSCPELVFAAGHFLLFAFLFFTFYFPLLLFTFKLYTKISVMNENCLFCKIVNGEIPSVKVYEDDVCVAFNDISPEAPTHILVIPREHLDSLDKAEKSHQETLGHLLLTAARIAREKEIAEDGYRVVINTNADGGQTVFHLHVHLLGGRKFVFPPG
jgi:histidine triad (HIT) family protein